MSISFNTYWVTLFILQFFGDPEEQQHQLGVRRVDQTDLQIEGLPQQRAQGQVVLGVEAVVLSIWKG